VTPELEFATVTTTFFLVRHAVHGLLNQVLVGRMAGVPLEQEGRDQAERLAERLASERITVVQSSPRERARETAEPIAHRAGVPIEIAAAIDEIDVGEWTGRPFAVLNEDSDWNCWNAARGTARPPRGESMSELQRRVVSHLNLVRSLIPDGRVVMVSHAEVIRAAILHYLDLPLDQFARIEIGPATISTVAIGQQGARVIALNEAVTP